MILSEALLHQLSIGQGDSEIATPCGANLAETGGMKEANVEVMRWLFRVGAAAGTASLADPWHWAETPLVLAPTLSTSPATHPDPR